MSEVIKVPAIGVSITANVDGDRQVVFQTAIDPDEGDASINALLDRLMGFASRQKLIGDIKSMKKELDQLVLDNMRYDMQSSEVKKNLHVANAQLDVQILEIQKKRKQIFDEGYQKHHADPNRRGVYKPRGQDEQAIARCDVLVEEAQKQKVTNQEGLEAELANNQTNIQRRLDRIEDLKKLIADGEAKVAA